MRIPLYVYFLSLFILILCFIAYTLVYKNKESFTMIEMVQDNSGNILSFVSDPSGNKAYTIDASGEHVTVNDDFYVTMPQPSINASEYTTAPPTTAPPTTAPPTTAPPTTAPPTTAPPTTAPPTTAPPTTAPPTTATTVSIPLSVFTF
jgi:hypothetical protein